MCCHVDRELITWCLMHHFCIRLSVPNFVERCRVDLSLIALCLVGIVMCCHCVTIVNHPLDFTLPQIRRQITWFIPDDSSRQIVVGWWTVAFR